MENSSISTFQQGLTHSAMCPFDEGGLGELTISYLNIWANSNYLQLHLGRPQPPVRLECEAALPLSHC